MGQPFLDRTCHLSIRQLLGLLLVLCVSAAGVIWAIELSRHNWIKLDAQQWYSWFPDTPSAQDHRVSEVFYTDVHYRVDAQYDYRKTLGRVVLRTRYNTDVDTGPVGHNANNGWLSRTVRLFQKGVIRASAWKDWDYPWLHDYQSEDRVYEFICPSQEIRHIQSRLESSDGLYANFYPTYLYGADGWRTHLDNWAVKVNRGDLKTLLNPLAPIWPRLCGEQHFSWELFEQALHSLEQEQHRIWIPFPDEVIDPTRTHAEFGDQDMDICAEHVTSGELTCRLLKGGDSTARHALLLPPGRYRFFQRLHGALQQDDCGNVLRGFGKKGGCNDGRRWFWRSQSHPHSPVEATLFDLGPGTSVGPKIRAFDLEQ